jgi:hypothetical protein
MLSASRAIRLSIAVRRGLKGGLGTLQQRYIVAAKFEGKDVKFDTQLDVDSFFGDGLLQSCTSLDIADLLKKSEEVTKKSSDKRYSLIRKHLPAIASRLTEIPESGMKNHEISSVGFGLRVLNIRDEGVSDILSIISKAAIRNLELGEKYKPRHVALLMLGLGGNKFELELNGKLIVTITKINARTPRTSSVRQLALWAEGDDQ